MSQVATEIANLALSHCGASKPIQSLDTDHSLAAQMCRTWFDTARRSTLTKIPWSFAAKQISPALVANQPTPEWLYAYQYPQDALTIIRFMSWRLNNDTRQSRIPYRVMQPVAVGLSTLATPPTAYAQTTGLWIYTNWPGVNSNLLPTIMEYIFDNQNIAQWPDNFNNAFSLMLASLIAPTLTSGNPQTTMAIIDSKIKAAFSEAEDNNLNEEQRPEEPQSEFIRGRGGWGLGYGYPGMEWIATPAGFEIQ